MIKWISPFLGSAAHGQFPPAGDLRIIDVRDLVDKPGNVAHAVRDKIAEAVGHIESGKRVVVCCDYGISRSNAMAAGILASYKRLPFNEAVREVMRATDERQIKIEVLDVVRAALGGAAVATTDRSAVLVTGGSGFLGAVLVERLQPRREVHNPSRTEIDLNKGAVDLDLFVKTNDIGCIVHLANPHIFNTNQAMGETLVLLKNVLDVCHDNQLRLIFPSGWEVFSGYKGDVEAAETLPPRPKGIYGETKYLCELLLKEHQRNFGLQHVLLRSGPVYGGGDRPKFLLNFIDKATRDEMITTHRYLNGFPRLDLLHVDDLITALVGIIESDYLGTLHLGSGRAISTADIARFVIDAIGSQSKIEHRDINEYAANVVMDCDRAKTVLDWRPQISFEEGLKRFLSTSLERGTFAETMP